MKKAQGLPLNTIVLGALAVLVLVILAAAFVPSIRDVFMNLLGFSSDPYAMCETACGNLQGRYSTIATAISAIQGSQFCSEGCTPTYKSDCTVSLVNGTTSSAISTAALCTTPTGLTWS
jgi:hypothetical protein